MIKIDGLEFKYNDKSKFNFPPLECDSGDELLILGPSGVGKTTLLHLMSGFIKPTKGQVFVSDFDISSLHGSKKDLFRANNIGIIFQENYFINSISIRQNLELAQSLAKQKKDTEKILVLAKNLGIDQLLEKAPAELSRGELQRASIIRALVNSPKVLLADEPTSSLDDANCEKVIKILKDQAKAHQAALIIVTHDSRIKSKFSKSLEL